MSGRKAVGSDILGIEVGRTVLRGVLLDAAVANVVGFAEVPLRLSPTESQPVGSADCNRIGPQLDIVLSRLGVDGRSVIATGISLGPRWSGVGSGPALSDWLASQAENLGTDLVFAGELGIAFAPKPAIDGAASVARAAGLGLVRVDLSPVAAARVLIDPTQDVASVGSGVGWRARLRDLEVVEALERPDILEDAPFQIMRADGQREPLTGYRRIAIPPGLRAAGFDPGQLAVAVGSAIGVANRSGQDLLDGTVIAAPEIPEPAPAPQQHFAPARTGEVPGTSVRPPKATATTIQRRPPMNGGATTRQPVAAGVAAGRPARARTHEAAITWNDHGELGAYDDEIDRFSTDNTQVERFTGSDTRLDLAIGFLLALTAILVPVYFLL